MLPQEGWSCDTDVSTRNLMVSCQPYSEVEYTLRLNIFPFSPLPASQGLPEGEHSHPSQPVRSKTPQIPQDPKGPSAAGPEQSHHPPLNRHTAQMDPHVHLQRAQGDTSQTSYPSPVAISMKQELPSPHQPQAVSKQSMFIPTTSGPPLSRPEPQSTLKQEPSPHSVSQRPVDMVQLLTVSVVLLIWEQITWFCLSHRTKSDLSCIKNFRYGKGVTWFLCCFICLFLMDFSHVYCCKSVLQVSIFLESVSSYAVESIGVFNLNKRKNHSNKCRK